MNTRVINLPNARHQQVLELLPWYVMDTLDADQQKLVDDHLAACDVCRRELQWHRQLRAAHDEPLPDYDVDGALARLRMKVPALQPPATAASVAPVRDRPWLYWTLAAQLVVICGLGALLMLDHVQPVSYHALGRPGAAQASARLVVMFAADASETQMRQALTQSHARIVDGPTVNGAYILAVAPRDLDRALATLRGLHSVKLVQPLDSGAAH